MDITLQYFDGCPNWHEADQRLLSAMAETGLTDVPVRYQQITTDDEAISEDFRGSPTIRINGEDPFADPGGQFGLACRLYPTSGGLSGSPTVQQIVNALRGVSSRNASGAPA